MSDVGQKERKTQNRVIKLFRERLGYEYGGNLEDQDNSNVDEELLRQSLLARRNPNGQPIYDEEIVGRAVQQVLNAASLGTGQSLYDANRRVYELLRYGAKVKRDVGEQFETVKLIDWEHGRPTTTLWWPRKSPSRASTPSARTSCCTSTALPWASSS